MRLAMTSVALRDVERDPGNGLFFFVCSSRGASGVVLAARVAKADADELVRRSPHRGTCVRVGRVEGEDAVTL